MRPLLLIIPALALTACQGRDPVADNASGANLPAPDVDRSPDAIPRPTDSAKPTQPASASTTAERIIPAKLQGRWGMTPADCTSTRGDAKGLVVISPTEIRFYESRALPSSDVQFGADYASGLFNFTGEGQSWTKFQALKVTGDKLVRTETNPAASFTYAKC